MKKRQIVSLSCAILLLIFSMISLGYSFSRTFLNREIESTAVYYPSYGVRDEIFQIAVFDQAVSPEEAPAKRREYYELTSYLNKRLDRPVQCVFPVNLREAPLISPTGRVDMVIVPVGLEMKMEGFEKANIRKVAYTTRQEKPGNEGSELETVEIDLYVNSSLNEEFVENLINALNAVPSGEKYIISMEPEKSTEPEHPRVF